MLLKGSHDVRKIVEHLHITGDLVGKTVIFEFDVQFKQVLSVKPAIKLKAVLDNKKKRKCSSALDVFS